ncbi:hypothetical protein FGK63_01580 [Ruegeria sediminis]|uniref:DUF6455 domain-containing protein n=1 Tax=Ruegeria sediminis TaxID=2583820 RepID=A0ABY2X328_9RHOB|nr:DUF6455 family protein [Ruegeria sediminis]TMV09786.1 hypothetical protein FGK63_01580 [Ruegeria sediminis]
MPPLGKIMTHLRLVLGMGRATGTDIVAAHEEGRLSQEDWAGMVQTCRACEDAGGCRAWLDQNESVEDAPKSCANRARLAALRRKQKEDE